MSLHLNGKPIVMRSSLVLLFITALIAGCKKNLNPEPAFQKPAHELAEAPFVADTTYEPKEAAAAYVGTLMDGGDTLTVISAYTNEIAYKQATRTAEGADSVMLYREREVRLAGPKGRAIIRKSDFERYLPKEEYGGVILQGVGITSAEGSSPWLTIWFCKPDTDLCYTYKVVIKHLQIAAVEEVPDEEI